jgi:hypothetical protein
MAAERDFLESKFKRSTNRQQELVGHIQVLRRQLLGAGMHPEVAAVRLQAPDDGSVASDDASPDASDEEAYRSPHPLLRGLPAHKHTQGGCVDYILKSPKFRLVMPPERGIGSEWGPALAGYLCLKQMNASSFLPWPIHCLGSNATS